MVTKTFRIKRDAEDWARRTEDEILRGAYIERATADRMTIKDDTRLAGEHRRDKDGNAVPLAANTVRSNSLCWATCSASR
jgi:hypothetical protein